MDFTYDDEQLALQEAARGALERACGPDVVRQLADEEAGVTPALWSTLADLGWTGLLVPEEYGGSGAGLLEMCVVLEEMGRIPLPGPFFSSSVSATLAARALGATELLAGLATGARRGTLAFHALPIRLAEQTLAVVAELGPGAKIPRTMVAAEIAAMNASLDAGGTGL